jgi:nucleotide-binding universal stress UspA family protein
MRWVIRVPLVRVLDDLQQVDLGVPLLPRHHHRAARLADDTLGDGAEEQPLDADLAVRADEEQIRADVGCHREDLLDWMADACMHEELDLSLGLTTRKACSDTLGDLALDTLRSRGRDVAPVDIRVERTDDVEYVLRRASSDIDGAHQGFFGTGREVVRDDNLNWMTHGTPPAQLFCMSDARFSHINSRNACASCAGTRNASTTSMLAAKTILVPTDFTPYGDAAVEYAAELATQLGATLHLLHVVSIPTFGIPELGLAHANTIIQQSVLEAQTELDQAAARLRDRVEVAPVRIEVGDAREVIDRIAAQIGADMIVLGTHGRRGFSRFFLGSVAESVVRTAPCPVVTVHQQAA